MSRIHERDEDLENALSRNSLWAITYGDLMSYLMIFFLLMFVFTYTKSMKVQMGFHNMENRFGETMRSELAEIFTQRGIQQFAEIELTPERLRLTFSQPILFDSGRAELRQQALPLLHRVANIIRDLPNLVMIEGHTDNIPVSAGSAYASNWELSTARAHWVLRYFVHEENIPPARMVAIGYGEYRPIDTNETDAGRLVNRRIEISINRVE